MSNKQITPTSNVTQRKNKIKNIAAREPLHETLNIVPVEPLTVRTDPEIDPQLILPSNPNPSKIERTELRTNINSCSSETSLTPTNTNTNTPALPALKLTEEEVTEHLEQANIEHVDTTLSPLSPESQIFNECELSANSTRSHEKRSKSVDYSANEMLTGLKMKAEISRLSMELVSTQNQFEDVCIENNGLKRTIVKLQRENETLKKLCKSSNLKVTSAFDNKKRHSIHTDKHSVFSQLNFSSTPTHLYEDKSHGRANPTTEVRHLNDQIQTLNEELKIYKGKISDLCTQVITLSQKILLLNNTEDCRTNNTELQSPSVPTAPKNETPCLINSKLYVISNHTNYMLQLIKDSLPSKNTCLYLSPGGGIRELFDDLVNKLRDFSFHDYCIIYIGDTDFKHSINYDSLVGYIQKQVSEVQHTNIIICLPTFKISTYSNLFIERVETFNNLLYKSNLQHEYSYILDSNLNLTFDNYMYSRLGNVNRRGFKTIFNDLLQLFTSIPTDNSDDSLTTNTLDSHHILELADTITNPPTQPFRD
jgi:hypothetical protein